jgi:hypothetical protein
MARHLKKGVAIGGTLQPRFLKGPLNAHLHDQVSLQALLERMHQSSPGGQISILKASKISKSATQGSLTDLETGGRIPSGYEGWASELSVCVS